jgi:hypothetical protein
MKALIRILFLTLVASLLGVLHPAVSQAQVAVTSADPPSAPQGTISLDVTVAGSGFDSSAQVDFLVTGTTNPGGISVKKVKVNGPKKLIATIDVAESAVVEKFDIQVRLSGGRKGKGTSLFAVVAKTNDPCSAQNLDFPAFTFRGPTEATEEVIYVADASGTCIRELGMFASFASDAVTTVFSYPVAGTADVGRIVWMEGSRTIYGATFFVTGTTITPFSTDLLYDSPGTDMRALDMSKDGATVYAALDSLHATDSYRIIAITVSDRSFTDVYVGAADSSDVTSLTVDESGSLLVTQEPPNAGVPTDLAYQVLRINPGCTNPSCATILATGNEAGSNGAGVDRFAGIAASLVDDRFVYEHTGVTTCSPVLQVKSNAGGPVLNAAYPFYGRRSSWYGGKILTNGVKVSKRGCTISGAISQFDPDSGSERVLVRGYDPDGR